MKTNISKSLLAAAALLGSAHFATAQIYSTNLGAGNTNYGNFSLASGGYNAIYGGYGNHALGWSCTIGTGSFNFLTGLQNVTAGNFNFVAGASNQPAGAYNLFAGQNNRGTGNQNLVFGSFLDAGALNGSVILSDGNPFSIRTAGARFTNTTANSFTGIFDGGYAWRTNSGQVGMGIGANAGVFIIPSLPNGPTDGTPAFVGINKPAPAQALDVVGNGVFSGNVTATSFTGNGTGLTGVALKDGSNTFTQTLLSTAGPNCIRHDLGGVITYMQISSGQGFVGTNSAHAFDIVTNNSSRIRVSAAGLVGVGRIATTNALEVEGNASKTTATAWLANSDRRIKTDVEELNGADALGKMRAVRPVAFHYTPDYKAAHPSIESRTYVNVIAQEFAEVFPESVKSSGEKLPGTDDSAGSGNEILQVDTYPLTIYSAAAIKELDARSSELRKKTDAQIAERDARIDELEARLRRLEKLLQSAK